MTLSIFFCLAFSAFYLTYLMVEAEITSGLRQQLSDRSVFFLAVLSCEKCSAFWAGLFCSILQVINPVLLYPLAAAGLVLFLWPLWEKVNNAHS